MNSARKAIIGLGLAGSTLLGGVIGASLIGTASAADNTSTSSTTAPAAAHPQAAPGPGQGPANVDPSKGGHTANGITETLLTGDTADKVTAAAKAAVPDGTIQRVETDAEGSPYEAHMTKSDGSMVTVKVDSSFKVTSIENGPR